MIVPFGFMNKAAEAAGYTKKIQTNFRIYGTPIGVSGWNDYRASSDDPSVKQLDSDMTLSDGNTASGISCDISVAFSGSFLGITSAYSDFPAYCLERGFAGVTAGSEITLAGFAANAPVKLRTLWNGNNTWDSGISSVKYNSVEVASLVFNGGADPKLDNEEEFLANSSGEVKIHISGGTGSGTLCAFILDF